MVLDHEQQQRKAGSGNDSGLPATLLPTEAMGLLRIGCTRNYELVGEQAIA
jgi:hypothetical protein